MTAFLLIGLLLLGSGVFSGAETGFYSLSRVRLRAEARQGRWIARLIELLTRNPAAFLITLLVGNNLCLELMTHLVEDEVSNWTFLPTWGTEVAVTLLLTPVVFFLGELFPKDLFRRRPRRLYGGISPILAVARAAFAPVAVPLAWLSSLLESLFGVRARELEGALGRERVQEVLSEGARAGVLPPRAQELAHNVVEFRTKTVTEVMIPWAQVATVDARVDPAETRQRVARSAFSRLPVISADGGAVVVRTYLHQLDLLADAVRGKEGRSLRAPAQLARTLPVITPAATVDRALARLRTAGQRMALVGSPEAPLGIVTLKDLVQTISGELGGW